MFCQAGFDQWLRTIMQHLPHLSKPQATVLALWSFGMVLARSCALTAVSHLLAKGLQAQGADRTAAAARMVLRHPTQAGRQAPSTPRRDLFCPSCWAGSSAGGRARNWRWPSMPQRWGHGSWCWRSVWSIAVVAIPVAWEVLLVGPKGGGLESHLRHSAGQAQESHTRYLDGHCPDRPWPGVGHSFNKITELKWHPMMRVKKGGKFRPKGGDGGAYPRHGRHGQGGGRHLRQKWPGLRHEHVWNARCWPAGTPGMRSRG